MRGNPPLPRGSTVRSDTRLLRNGEGAWWASLDELVDSAALAAFVQREFPSQAAVWRGNRRRFLELMGASLALAGAIGCRVRPPEEMIVPFVQAPEHVVPGKPLYFRHRYAGGWLGHRFAGGKPRGTADESRGQQAPPRQPGRNRCLRPSLDPTALRSPAAARGQSCGWSQHLVRRRGRPADRDVGTGGEPRGRHSPVDRNNLFPQSCP